MPFKFHPPTRSECDVCQSLVANDIKPITNGNKGKASSANDFPIHNWYNFVLGYSPGFPNYIIEKENLKSSDLVVDPFMGSGTTLVCCKLKGIPSKGIDANDFMFEAARTKLCWNLDVKALEGHRDQLVEFVESIFDQYNWNPSNKLKNKKLDIGEYVKLHRPELLPNRYISDKPFLKLRVIQQAIKTLDLTSEEKDFFSLALSSILIPVSNVRYGPGFGVVSPKDNIDVLSIFRTKINRMIYDLETLDPKVKNIPSHVVLGDSRNLSSYFEKNSVSYMITSPPYPGDHEYTKHSKLELIFENKATNNIEFRKIKRRMLQASTTNIYHDTHDRDVVIDLEIIKNVTNLIQERLIHDHATSGFEKLYTKLVWEYFGGMQKCLEESFKVIKPGGKIALLVSDSHAFKMVHIQTAEILKQIGHNIGYVNPDIALWQLKTSTSHKYFLRENILFLTKPTS